MSLADRNTIWNAAEPFFPRLLPMHFSNQFSPVSGSRHVNAFQWVSAQQNSLCKSASQFKANNSILEALEAFSLLPLLGGISEPFQLRQFQCLELAISANRKLQSHLVLSDSISKYVGFLKLHSIGGCSMSN